MAITVKQAAVIDKKGNITIHGRAGFERTIKRGDPPRDISADVLYFEIEGICRIELEAGDTPQGRKIIIQREDFETLETDTPTNFALIDESGDVDVVIWSGTVTRKAYIGEPT